MWNFTQHGFVSVVAYDPSKDRKKDSPFPKIAKQAGTHLLVRARIKADLDQLKKVVPSLVIDTDAGADYAYRAVVTRAQYKKFLVATVDNIDYDSHFKEAANANSPKVQGRMSAYMGVWSEMAKLQDISPWSGGSRGWTSTYGSGKSGKGANGKAVSAAETDAALWDWDQYDFSAGRKGSKTVEKIQGAPTVEDFMADPGFYGGVDAPKFASGPRTGFKAGDIVYGVFGKGKVAGVKPRKRGKSDLVTVYREAKNGQAYEKAAVAFASNYLVPDLTDWIKEQPVVDAEIVTDGKRDITLDGAYDMLMNARSVKVEDEILARLDDDAFELVTRMQEVSSDFDSQRLDQFYSEIQWESADGEMKVKIASEGTVPDKYVAEAQRVLDQVAAQVASDAAGA